MDVDPESADSQLYISLKSVTGMTLSLKVNNMTPPPPKHKERVNKYTRFEDGDGTFFDEARKLMYKQEEEMKKNSKIMKLNTFAAKYHTQIQHFKNEENKAIKS